MNQLKQFLAFFLFICLATFSYGQGEDCQNALVITEGMYTADGPATGMGSLDSLADGSGGGGMNADWYSFTPTVSGFMGISACLGGADTRVFVYDGGCAAPNLVAENDDFCEVSATVTELYASFLEGVAVTGGVEYLIEFDDTWDQTGFDWTLSFDPAPDFDVALVADAINYYQIPATQLGVDLEASITNLGLMTLNGVELTADVKDATGASVFTSTSTAVMVMPGQTITISAGNWAGAQGDYTIDFSVATSDGELAADMGNNTISDRALSIDVTYAVDNNVFAQGIGIDGPGPITQGQTFDIQNADMLTSLSWFVNGGAAGDTLTVGIWEVNADTVGNTIWTSSVIELPSAGPGWMHFVLPTPLALDAGTQYMAGVTHIATGTNIGLGYTLDPFIPGNSWLMFNGSGGWANPEAFGFPLAYMIRMNFGVSSHEVTVNVDMTNEEVLGDVIVAWANAGGGPNVVNMVDPEADDVWTATFTVNALDTIGWIFANGDGSDLAQFEGVPMDCGADGGSGFNVRPLVVNFGDMMIPPVCFSACDACPPPACVVPNAIFCDDFESYNAGDYLGSQSPDWTTWTGADGTPEDANVSDMFAFGGSNSAQLLGGQGVDAFLPFATVLTSGRYSVSLKMYVPAGKEGYYNIQKTNVAGEEWHSEVYFNGGGNGSLNAGAAGAATFTYPEDAWFDIVQIMDIDNDVAEIWIDETVVYTWTNSWQADAMTGANSVGGINLYPANANNEYYIDNVIIRELPPCPAGYLFCDHFEMYLVDYVGPQSPYWTTWTGADGTAEDGFVANTQSSTPFNSMEITGGLGQDIFLVFGEMYQSGNFDLGFDMYVPAGAEGYYNIQKTQTAGDEWAIEVFYDGGGVGRFLVSGNTFDFTYPEDTWFRMDHLINLDADLASSTIDGTAIASWPFSDQANAVGGMLSFGGINFFPGNANNNYFIDGVTLVGLTPTVVSRMITLNVDAQYIDNDPNAMHVAGNFQGWDPSTTLMTDNGDDSYTYTFMANEGDTIQYKFINGNSWGSDETQITADCGVDNGQGGFNRVLYVNQGQDIETIFWCYDSCSDCVTATKDPEFAGAIKVYPNPATDFAIIEYDFESANDLTISVHNALGAQMSQQSIDGAVSGQVNINTQDYASGMYFINITNGTKITSEKLIIR